MEQGAAVVDARYKTTFAGAHIPGSWGMELGSGFATWIGWLLPFDAPMVLILDEGREAVSHATMTARQYLEEANGSRQLVDVRAPTEWEDGTLDGSVLCHLPNLVESIPEDLDPEQLVYLGCTTGHRASIAAGILADRGYEPVVLTGASLLGVIMLMAQETSPV